MNMKSTLCAFAVLTATVSSAVQVSGVSARQRWPWNNLVDVEFTVSDAADGETYCADLSAQYRGGEVTVAAVTLLDEPIVKAGRNRLTWDFGRDCPDFKADDMQMTVSVFPFSDATPVYLVIDVSSGAASTSYPVRYTTKAPVHTVGVNDPCKTSEIWLKRVKAGTFTAGGSNLYGYPSHTCILTEDFYLGVFPITQAQWANVGSGNLHAKLDATLTFFTNALCAATRPMDMLSYRAVRDSSYMYYSENETLTQDSFIKRLRDRTGLSAIDLPTEWQWEYACHAGTTGVRYPDAQYRNVNNSLPEGKKVADKDGEWGEEYGTSYVDRYPANPWGFYAMLGNVQERCVNMTETVTEGSVLTDPKGPAGQGGNNTASRKRAVKGGNWTTTDEYTRIFNRTAPDEWNATGDGVGARLCLTVQKAQD